MPRSSSRGRTRTRSLTPRDVSRSRSPVRSRSPRRDRSYSRDRPGRSISPRRSLSPREAPRNGGRRTRSRSYSRSRSRSPRYDRSTKVCGGAQLDDDVQVSRAQGVLRARICLRGRTLTHDCRLWWRSLQRTSMRDISESCLSRSGRLLIWIYQ